MVTVMMLMMMMMIHYSQVVKGVLRVLVAHLLCHVGQLVCGAHLRGQCTQTTQTVTFSCHGYKLKYKHNSGSIGISLTAAC